MLFTPMQEGTSFDIGSYAETLFYTQKRVFVRSLPQIANIEPTSITEGPGRGVPVRISQPEFWTHIYIILHIRVQEHNSLRL